MKQSYRIGELGMGRSYSVSMIDMMMPSLFLPPLQPIPRERFDFFVLVFDHDFLIENDPAFYRSNLRGNSINSTLNDYKILQLMTHSKLVRKPETLLVVHCLVYYKVNTRCSFYSRKNGAEYAHSLLLINSNPNLGTISICIKLI